MTKILFILLSFFCVASVWGTGAPTPFATYYAESPDHSRALGNGATVVTADSGNAYIRLETAHHAYVALNGSAQPYIAFTSVADANTIVVRYSLPYSPTENHNDAFTLSLYINNVLQPTPLSFALKYIHADEGGNSSFWPAGASTPLANVQRWWEEETLMLTGTTIHAGDRIKLQKNSGDTASAYYLDTIDLEQAAPALTMPAGAHSITAYGAVGGANGDPTTNTQAVVAAINATKVAGASKIVWIPVGVFNVNAMITLDAPSLVIQGAGMWRSTLRNIRTDFTPPAHFFSVQADHVKVTDLKMDFAANSRRSQDGTQSGGHHFFGAGGNYLWLERMWFKHGATPAWYNGNDGTFIHNRVRCTYADSFHLQDNASRNLISENHSRGIGDDGIVQWSHAGQQGFNNQFTFNTVEAQYMGRGIAFFGGQGNVIDSNLITGGNITWGLLLRPEVKSVASAPIVNCSVTNNRFEWAGMTSTASIKADYATIDTTVTGNTFATLPAGGVIIAGSKKITANVTNNVIGHPVTGTWIDTSGVTNGASVVTTTPNTLQP